MVWSPCEGSVGCHTPQLEAGSPILSGPEAFRSSENGGTPSCIRGPSTLRFTTGGTLVPSNSALSHLACTSPAPQHLRCYAGTSPDACCRAGTCSKGLTLAAWHRKRKAHPPDPRPYRLGCLIHVLIAGVRLGGHLFLLLPLPSNLHRINCRARMPTLHCHLGAHTSNQQVERTGSIPAFIR